MIMRRLTHAEPQWDHIQKTRVFGWRAGGIKVGACVKDQLIGAGFKLVGGQDLFIRAIRWVRTSPSIR